MSHNPRASINYTLDDQLVVYGDNSYRYDDDGYLAEKVTPNGATTYSYGSGVEYALKLRYTTKNKKVV